MTSDSGLKGLDRHFASAVAKPTKKEGSYIFKFMVAIRSQFRNFFDVFEFVLMSQGAEVLVGTAPRGPLIRELDGKIQ